MNKIFGALCASVLVLISCSKEEKQNINKVEKLYPVTFHVNTFSAEILPMTNTKGPSNIKSMGTDPVGLKSAESADDWLGNKISTLNFYVIDGSGEVIHSHKSHSYLDAFDSEGNVGPKVFLNENFGIIEGLLPAGDYRIAIVGSHSSPATTIYGGGDDGLLYLGGSDDIFATTLWINVNGETINQSVTLERVVGKLEIQLLDDAPEYIHSVEYSISEISAYYYVWYVTDDPIDAFWKTAETSSPTFKDDLWFYFGYQGFKDSQPSKTGFATVHLRAYGRAGMPSFEKTITNVPVGVNKRTVLKGRLFDAPGTTRQNFSVSINDEWQLADEVTF